jgi:hypothetical protein
MLPKRGLALSLGIAIAAASSAQQAPSPASAVRIAELEAQIAKLTQQLELMRASRAPEIRWTAPTGLPAPASPLQRAAATASIEAGCPPGSVCLVVRCDAPHGR